MDAPSADNAVPAKPGRNVIRWSVRAAALVGAAIMLSPLARDGKASLWVPSASALVALCALAAWLPATWSTAAGLAPAAIAVFKRRWFCRWICPLGTCAELAGRLGTRLGCRGARLPPAGQWLALATLAGAAVGWPLFVWLDPLAMFTAGVGAIGFWATPARWMFAVLLFVVLAGSLVLPGVWCSRLCPLGGTQEFLAAVGEWALRRRPVSFDQHEERRSPFGTRNAVWRLDRRTVLAGLVGLAGALGMRRWAAEAPPLLRPPGAAPEELFGGLCVRCGNCVRACPTQVIFPATAGIPLPALLTPVVRFGENYCLETCVRCTEVCPSGALARLVPQAKAARPMGLAEVDLRLCLRAWDQECALCRAHCPYQAVTYVFSEEEYISVPRVDPARCPGCGACEVACPTRPTKAIVVRPLTSLRRQSLPT